MDLSAFLALIAATPVLSDADRARHARYASGYSPELRARMAAIIAEEERALVAAHAASREEAAKRARQKMAGVRVEENRERESEKRAAIDIFSDISFG